MAIQYIRTLAFLQKLSVSHRLENLNDSSQTEYRDREQRNGQHGEEVTPAFSQSSAELPYVKDAMPITGRDDIHSIYDPFWGALPLSTNDFFSWDSGAADALSNSVT